MHRILLFLQAIEAKRLQAKMADTAEGCKRVQGGCTKRAARASNENAGKNAGKNAAAEKRSALKPSAPIRPADDDDDFM